VKTDVINLENYIVSTKNESYFDIQILKNFELLQAGTDFDVIICGSGNSINSDEQLGQNVTVNSLATLLLSMIYPDSMEILNT